MYFCVIATDNHAVDVTFKVINHFIMCHITHLQYAQVINLS